MSSNTYLRRRILVGVLCVVGVLGVAYVGFAGSLMWNWWSKTGDHPITIASPDESVLLQLPNGYYANMNMKHRVNYEPASLREPSTYVVVDAPRSTEEAIDSLVIAYEREDWELLLINDGSMTKKNQGCLSFKSKDDFIAEHDAEDSTARGIVQWVNRAANNPTNQVVVSLGC